MTFTPYGGGRMKFVIVVIAARDLDELSYALRRRGHAALVVDVSGGFGHQGNATLFVGVQETWLFDLLGIIEETCGSRVRTVSPSVLLADPPDFISRPLEERDGGAIVCVLSLDRYERIA